MNSHGCCFESLCPCRVCFFQNTTAMTKTMAVAKERPPKTIPTITPLLIPDFLDSRSTAAIRTINNQCFWYFKTIWIWTIKVPHILCKELNLMNMILKLFYGSKTRNEQWLHGHSLPFLFSLSSFFVFFIYFVSKDSWSFHIHENPVKIWFV